MNRLRMLCPEPKKFSEKGMQFARSFLDVSLIDLSQKEFTEVAKEYDAVLIRFSRQVTRPMMEDVSRLRYIVSPTTGFNHIDLSAASSNDVNVFFLRGETEFLEEISSTAEHTIGLLLALIRKIPWSFESIKNGSWTDGRLRGLELKGKIAGIVGFGRLGRQVAALLSAFGMSVMVFDPYVKEVPELFHRAQSLEDLLTASDVISLHIHLDPENVGLLGEREFDCMKRSAILINSSRAEIVDQVALLQSLESGKLGAAAIDVLANENNEYLDEDPLVAYARSNRNLLITAHIGGATFEAIEKTDLFVLQKFRNYLESISVG